jgi:hypothetical protein
MSTNLRDYACKRVYIYSKGSSARRSIFEADELRGHPTRRTHGIVTECIADEHCHAKTRQACMTLAINQDFRLESLVR